MKNIVETTHLSEILEHSEKEPVIIFKYSNNCGSSDRLLEKLKKEIESEVTIYLVTVQIQKVLSEKISQWFSIKHESPQIIKIRNGKVLYTAHHNNIDLKNFT